MPAGPGGAGMPACPLGVSVIGGTMEPRAQWSVGGTHRQHADPPGLYSWISRGQGHAAIWGCSRHPSPWPLLLRGASRMHLTHRPAERLTWQLPAVTLPAAAQNLRHLLRLPLATCFGCHGLLHAQRQTGQHQNQEGLRLPSSCRLWLPKSHVLGSSVPH